jgi:excisionase family DNA binding protein
LAVVALAEVGRIRGGFRNGQRVWWYGGADKRSTVPSPLRTQYTVAEAAALTGLKEKALRRRIERNTLKVERVGRFVFVSHAALQDAD